MRSFKGYEVKYHYHVKGMQYRINGIVYSYDDLVDMYESIVRDNLKVEIIEGGN